MPVADRGLQSSKEATGFWVIGSALLRGIGLETFPLIVMLAASGLCAAIAVPVARNGWSDMLGERVRLRSVRAFLNCC